MAQSLTIAKHAISSYYYTTTTVREIQREIMKRIINQIASWIRTVNILIARTKGVIYTLRNGSGYKSFYYEDTVVFIGITRSEKLNDKHIQRIIKIYYLDNELLKYSTDGRVDKDTFIIGACIEQPLDVYHPPKSFSA